MRTTEMVLFAHFLKTSKFIPACISIYIYYLWLQRCKGGWKFGNCDSKENANFKVLFCYERGGYVRVQMGSAPTPPLLCIFPWAYRYLPFRSFFTQLNFAKFSKMSVHVNSAVFTMFFAFTVNSDKYACRLYKRKSPCPTNIYIGQVDISVQEYSIVLIILLSRLKK